MADKLESKGIEVGRDVRQARVFLSYSRQDASQAVRIQDGLTAAAIEVLRDVDSTLPGEEWWWRIQNLIESADVIVFLLSSRSAASSICAAEVHYSSELGKRIIPVLIESVDWNSVPEGLARVHGVEMLDPSSWADSMALLTRSINLDIVTLREHTRLLERALRWRDKAESPAELLTGDAIDEAEHWLSQLVSPSISATSLHSQFILASREAQRSEQTRLLKESEEQRKILERERDRAAASFHAGLDVLSEVHERLLVGLANTRGVSLITRELVTRTLLDANKRLTEAGPDFYPSSVQMQLAGNQMMATTTLAEVLIEQEKFDEAEKFILDAMKLAKKFYDDDYNPLQRRPGLRQYARLLAFLADLRYRQGNIGPAIELLSGSIELREKAVGYYSQHGPAADVRHDLADALQRLSVLYIVSQRPAESLTASKRALTIVQKLVDEYPSEDSLRYEMAGVLNSVGDGLFETGKTTEAAENFRRAADIFDEALAQFPDSLFLLRAKSISLERFGNLEVHAERFAEALSHYETCLELKEQLLRADPGNAQYAHDKVVIDRKIGAIRSLIQQRLGYFDRDRSAQSRPQEGT